MQGEWALLRRKLRALNYPAVFSDEAAPLVDRLLGDLLKASEAYQSAKAAAPRPEASEADAWRAVRAAERENAELHAALIAKEKQLAEAIALGGCRPPPELPQLREELARAQQKELNALQGEVLRLRGLVEGGHGLRARAEAEVDLDRRKTEELLQGQIGHLNAVNERLRAELAQLEPLRAAERRGAQHKAELELRVTELQRALDARPKGEDREQSWLASVELLRQEIGRLQHVVERAEREKDTAAAEKALVEAQIDHERQQRAREANERVAAESVATEALLRVERMEQQLTEARLTIERMRSEAVAPQPAEPTPRDPPRPDISPLLVLRERELEGLRQLLEKERETRLDQQKMTLELQQRLEHVEADGERVSAERAALQREAESCKVKAESAERQRRASELSLKAAQLDLQRIRAERDQTVVPATDSTVAVALEAARTRAEELAQEMDLLRGQIEQRDASVSATRVALHAAEAETAAARLETVRLRARAETDERRREGAAQNLIAAEARAATAEHDAEDARMELAKIRLQLEQHLSAEKTTAAQLVSAQQQATKLAEELVREQLQTAALGDAKSSLSTRANELSKQLQLVRERADLADQREQSLQCSLQLKAEEAAGSAAEVLQLRGLLRAASDRQSLLAVVPDSLAEARRSARFEEELGALRAQLASAEAEAAHLRECLARLDAERDELVGTLDAQSSALDRDQQQTRQHAQRVEEAQLAAEEWRQAALRAHAEVEEVLTRFEALSADRARLAEELATLCGQLEAAEAVKQDLAADLQLLARDGAVLAAEAETAHRRREAIERRASDRAERLQTAELQLAAAAVEREQLAANCQELTRQLTAAKAGVVRLQTAVDAGRNEAADVAAERRSVLGRSEELQRQIERLQLELAAAKQDVTQLTLQLQTETVATAEVESDAEAERKKSKALMQAVAELQRELSARETALASVHDELNSQRQVFLHLKVKNEELSGKYVALLRRHSS